jgi:Ankyrin repeats (many copies)
MSEEHNMSFGALASTRFIPGKTCTGRRTSATIIRNMPLMWRIDLNKKILLAAGLVLPQNFAKSRENSREEIGMFDAIDWRAPSNLVIVKALTKAIDDNDIEAARKILSDYNFFADCFYHKDTERFQLTLLNRFLFDASCFGTHKMAELFLSFDADVNQPEYRGPGEGVIRKLADVDAVQHCETIEWLINEHAAIFLHMRNGSLVSDTLHGATMCGSLRLVRFLIERGAPINCLSRNGLTALDFANMENLPEIAVYLRTQGAMTGAEVQKQMTENHPSA